MNSCLKEVKNNKTEKGDVNFALVVHGGAGSIYKGRYSNEQENQYKSKLEDALKVGYDILNVGGSSVDAVESVIRPVAEYH